MRPNAARRGRSGVDHTFDYLVLRRDGFTNLLAAVEVINDAEDPETSLHRLFAFQDKCSDCGISRLVVIAIPRLSFVASQFAQKDGVDIFDEQALQMFLSRAPAARASPGDLPATFVQKSEVHQSLKTLGYRVDETVRVAGQSGADHVFGAMALWDDGFILSRLGIDYLYTDSVDKTDISVFDQKCRDAGITERMLLIPKGMTAEAKGLAQERGIEVISLDGRPREIVIDGLDPAPSPSPKPGSDGDKPGVPGEPKPPEAAAPPSAPGKEVGPSAPGKEVGPAPSDKPAERKRTIVVSELKPPRPAAPGSEAGPAVEKTTPATPPTPPATQPGGSTVFAPMEPPARAKTFSMRSVIDQFLGPQVRPRPPEKSPAPAAHEAAAAAAAPGKEALKPPPVLDRPAGATAASAAASAASPAPAGNKDTEGKAPETRPPEDKAAPAAEKPAGAEARSSAAKPGAFVARPGIPPPAKPLEAKAVLVADKPEAQQAKAEARPPGDPASKGPAEAPNTAPAGAEEAKSAPKADEAKGADSKAASGSTEARAAPPGPAEAPMTAPAGTEEAEAAPKADEVKGADSKAAPKPAEGKGPNGKAAPGPTQAKAASKPAEARGPNGKAAPGPTEARAAPKPAVAKTGDAAKGSTEALATAAAKIADALDKSAEAIETAPEEGQKAKPGTPGRPGQANVPPLVSKAPATPKLADKDTKQGVVGSPGAVAANAQFLKPSLDKAGVDKRQGLAAKAKLPEKPGEQPKPVVEEPAEKPKVKLSKAAKPEALQAIPESTARRFTVLPISVTDNVLEVAMVNPSDLATIQVLELQSKMRVKAVAADQKEILDAIDFNYKGFGQIAEQISHIETGADTSAGVDLVASTANAPVAAALNLIVEEAVKARASDIHIEPEEKRLRVRYRIDGVLQEVMSLPIKIHPPLTSRVKVMSDLNIADHLRPQDGQFSLDVKGKGVDVRVATSPTVHGETVVMRILDKSMAVMELPQLGFTEDCLAKYMKMLAVPFGMICVSGPTGAGKTTTLYASLNTMDKVTRNIITAEDPVEYRFEGIKQIQVNPKAGLTFASVLRSMMRLDPDVILVGEVRDAETASIAVKAALTGHTVLCSIHANDAVSVVYRLLDLGVEPFMVASVITGTLAQRMARRVCANCAVETKPTEVEAAAYESVMGEKLESFVSGSGCDLCNFSGYKGRLGLYEILAMTDTTRAMVLKGATTTELRNQAVKEGMVTLFRDGMQKVKAGKTTVSEVMRNAYSIE